MIKNFKQFNENVAHEDIMSKISFKGETLKYWLEYADGNRTYKNVDQFLERNIKKIIDIYAGRDEESDGEETEIDNEEGLIRDMLDLATLFIKLTGQCDKGCLEAFCSHNMKDKPEPWEESDKLVKTNMQSGVFEN